MHVLIVVHCTGGKYMSNRFEKGFQREDWKMETHLEFTDPFQYHDVRRTDVVVETFSASRHLFKFPPCILHVDL